MFHIVLYEPEIAPNTGNAMRLASNTGARLHLVRPLGFSLRDRQLVRAGMDYADRADVTVHDDWSACLGWLGDRRVFAVTTRGTTCIDVPAYAPEDTFVFGSETRGLPQGLVDAVAPDRRIRVPMRLGNRSINLSNAVSIVVYEAWRQHGYAGSSVLDEPR